MVPAVTYGMDSPLKIYFDSEIIDIIPLLPAHTDGDTMVRFEKADIIMAGDFYTDHRIPRPDRQIDRWRGLAYPNRFAERWNQPCSSRAFVLPCYCDRVHRKITLLDVRHQPKQRFRPMHSSK